MCVHACVCVCVRACVRAYVGACVNTIQRNGSGTYVYTSMLFILLHAMTDSVATSCRFDQYDMQNNPGA